MATDPNLRDLFDRDTPAMRRIDTASVIRRSKTRRLPAQVVIGGAFVLAVGGLGVAGLQGLGGAQSASDSAVSTLEQAPAGSDGGAKAATEGDATGIKRAPADRLNLCGGALAEVAPSATGLVLTVDFPGSPVGTAPVAGTATLTNTGTETVVGYTSPTPAITLSQAGTVLWHSNGPTILSIQDVTLAPGESLEFAASFAPVVCSTEDDTAEAFRSDLPPVAAGDYMVTAAADVSVDGVAELVTGPGTTVRIG
ncbi:hypothetical protein GCM10027413_23580 [Conyzicola nivalis]|uniref:Uncharacterized protein n=1 Tax=Conyzicola nivalis TaxID=1477021 RepID=A0A916SBN3_9MICO|nr:hypothetical protein [Conyzicola nivalis]GGA91740.1 hypothetical protein GCM10010979_03040 [Conyzicola nivalis]